jgi:hypothetical protein
LLRHFCYLEFNSEFAFESLLQAEIPANIGTFSYFLFTFKVSLSCDMSVIVHSEIDLRSIFIAVLKKNIPRVPIFIGLSAFATNPTAKPEFNLKFLNFLNFVLFNH